jgi:hypothetical protein
MALIAHYMGHQIAVTQRADRENVYREPYENGVIMRTHNVGSVSFLSLYSTHRVATA